MAGGGPGQHAWLKALVQALVAVPALQSLDLSLGANDLGFPSLQELATLQRCQNLSYLGIHLDGACPVMVHLVGSYDD